MSKQLIMPERLIEPEYSERRIKQRQGQRQTDLNLQITRLQQPPQQKHLKKRILTITPGASFGHLTVLEETKERENGYTVWRCRCDCGNEYLAASRKLKNGGAVSCKDPSCEYYAEALRIRHHREDLTGRRFGKLTVLGPAMAEQKTPDMKEVKRDDNGRILWDCKCDCGNKCEATSSELKTGNRKSCGCLSRPPLKDWIGHRFGKLVVKAYDGKRNGYHYWRCLCDCGNETVVLQTSLLRGHTSSCGCQAKISADKRTLVDGTCVEVLRAALTKGTIPKNNSSGVRGVYWQKKQQKWCAQIMFKGKMIYLGSYKSIGEAKMARKRAEQKYFGEFLEEYDARQLEEYDARQREEVQTGRTPDIESLAERSTS